MPKAVDEQVALNSRIYRNGGDVPLVLIHGAGGSRLSWPPEIRRLRGFTVYAIDLPGHGKSPGVGCRSVEAYAQATIAWMQVTRLDQAVFAGHSMGAAVALTLALLQPERVRALALLGSAASLKVNPTLIELASSAATFARAVELIVRWSFSKQAPARLVELVQKRMAETPPEVLLADLLACDAFDASSQLSQVKQPALVLCGTEDKMTPLQAASSLAEALPNARLKPILHAGHMLMLERPDEVADLLAKFLGG